MGKPEGLIETYLAVQAVKHDCLYYKYTSPGTRGVPDRILIGHGKVIFIELKSKTGHLSRQQELRIADMRKHGAVVYVLNSKDAVDEFFEKEKLI